MQGNEVVPRHHQTLTFVALPFITYLAFVWIFIGRNRASPADLVLFTNRIVIQLDDLEQPLTSRIDTASRLTACSFSLSSMLAL